MKINLQTTINGASQSVEAEIRGVNVYIETAFGRSVIQLREKSELAAIEPYAEVIQGMADAYAALKNPQQEDDVSDETSESEPSGANGAGTDFADSGTAEIDVADLSETSSITSSEGA